MCRINPLPGHPDLVLARAIRDHIIDRPQADLIGATRLEHESLSPAAARWCLPYQTCRRQRRCAERRLVRYLGHRSLIGPHRGHDNA